MEMIARLRQGERLTDLCREYGISRKTDPEYPIHDDALRVDHLGHIRFPRRKIYLAKALAGQLVGVREELDGRWLVTFAHIDLGHIAPDDKVAPLPQPALGV